MKRLNVFPLCFCVCMLFSVLFSGCAAQPPQPLPEGLEEPTGDVPTAPESILPSEPDLNEENSPEPKKSSILAGMLPPEPTAQMFGFEGLDAALFDGAYAAYFGQQYLASFEDFPRIVIPHINVLGSYEDGGVLYYVCDIMYKMHNYDEESGTFISTFYDESTGTYISAVGSLAIPCRIGLIDKLNENYEVESGLLPPNGAQYGSVMREIFGPLDDLYERYTSMDSIVEEIWSFPSSEEMWSMYIQATGLQEK